MKGILKLLKKKGVSDKKEDTPQENQYIPDELRLEKTGKQGVIFEFIYYICKLDS